MDTDSPSFLPLNPWDMPLTSHPAWPAPDPEILDYDAYHPPDRQRPTFAGYAADATICRVQWMAFDPNTPAANASEETWTSVVEAYRMLPHPLAIETIILAHVALTHRIVENIARLVCPDAMRLERRRRKPCASIAEEWFSIGLLKLVEVVQGDPKREQSGLRWVGEQHGWEEWNEPKHIANYLGECVKNEIWQSLANQDKDRLRVLDFLQMRHPCQKAGKIKRGEIDQVEELSCPSGACVAFHQETPDRIVAEREALDAACGDIFDRLLLLMKRDGATETQIGRELGMSRDQVQSRLQNIRNAMQGNLDLPRNGSSKRAQRKALPVIWGKEHWQQ